MSLEIIISPLARQLGWVPVPATQDSAGIDVIVCTDKPIDIAPEAVAKIPLGFKLHPTDTETGQKYAGLLIPRSGTSGQWSLANTVGLIDPDYQGEWMLNVRNNTYESLIRFVPGERIAQFVLIKVEDVHSKFKQVGVFSSDTGRGPGAFGHTGRFQMP
jgi:dUTP pyrophosphatase